MSRDAAAGAPVDGVLSPKMPLLAKNCAPASLRPPRSVQRPLSALSCELAVEGPGGRVGCALDLVDDEELGRGREAEPAHVRFAYDVC